MNRLFVHFGYHSIYLHGLTLIFSKDELTWKYVDKEIAPKTMRNNSLFRFDYGAWFYNGRGSPRIL